MTSKTPSESTSHTDARAAGCFGGASDPGHCNQPTAMDEDHFMRLYTQQCICKKPEAYRCTLSAEELA